MFRSKCALKMLCVCTAIVCVILVFSWIPKGQASSSENANIFVNYALSLVGKTKSELGLGGNWCGAFVNYCAQNCGLSEYIPNGSSVNNLSRADYPMLYGYKFGAQSYYFFDDMAGYLSGTPNCQKSDITTFTPQPGDIITLRQLKSKDLNDDYVSRWAHVGIVYHVDSTKVYIVHGNWGSSSNQVTTEWFYRSSARYSNSPYYCPAGYTRPAFPASTIQNDWQLHVMTIGRINVREAASESSAIVCSQDSITDYHFYIDASQPGDYGGWVYVKLMNDVTGWVNLAGTEVLSTVPRPSASEMQPFKAKMRVKGDYVARWDAPGGALLPRELMEGDELSVESKYTDKNGDSWYFTDDCFVYASDLELVELSEETKTEYVVVVDGGLYINKEYNKKNVAIKNMPKGTHFWADMSTAVKAGKYTWAYCTMADGTTGWVAISNPDYCVPVTSCTGGRCPGDASGDGVVELDDIMLMIDYYCGLTTNVVETNCDLDNDGMVCDLPDIMMTIDIYCSLL